VDSLTPPARRLADLGAGPGRRLGLLVEPDPGGATLILAAAELGCRVSLLNPRWTGPELARALEVLDPERVMAGPGVVLPDGFRGGLPGGIPLDRWSHPARDLVLEPRTDDWRRMGRTPVHPDPEWTLWTSGSTGEPRGIVLSHDALRASAAAVAERLGLGGRDRWIASLLPAHVGGLALILRAGILGSSLLLPGRFDPAGFNRLVDREGATHASLVPTQLLAVLEERGDRPFPGSFRALLLGGAATPPDLLDRALAAAAPVALTYGMTEAASQVATALPELVRRKPGTVGAPLAGIEVEAGSEKEGPREIRVRGATLARGVVRGPGDDPAPLVDPEGWYATGDLGVLDEEGHLRVTGRISERIISGGVNVDPREVEAVLSTHPGVGEVVVLGIPDARWGERVVAVVVPADSADTPELDDLLEHARPHVSPAKRPRGLVVRDELPRTATGKVDRRRLAQELRDRGAGGAGARSPSADPSGA
jgi:o-succinylbenzoate---CoA ligase